MMFRHGAEIDLACCTGSYFAIFAGNITGSDIDILTTLQADVLAGRHTAALDFFVVSHDAVVVEAAAVPDFGILHSAVLDGVQFDVAAGCSGNTVCCSYVRAC